MSEHLGRPGPTRRPARRPVNGLTLIEVLVTGSILAVTLSYAVPRFHAAVEQTRVDLAGANLTVVWTAQRMYRLDNEVFATDLAVLVSAGLLDSGYSRDPHFSYAVVAATSDTLDVTATRVGSNTWSGTLHISELGELTGEVVSGEGRSLRPPAL